MADTQTAIDDFLRHRAELPGASAPEQLDFGWLIIFGLIALGFGMAWLRREERRRSGR